MDSSTGTVTSFDYDGLSRRLAIGQSDSSGNHAETRYLWCGDELCGARDTSGQVLADYFPQGEQHDNYTVSGTRETANDYYLRDQIGSIIGVIDAVGNLLGSTDYTSYGMTRSAIGQQADMGYAGMLRSPAAGLYLTKYRAYSPSAGRWLSRDPIGMAGGENIYAYVGGDPVGNFDSLGLYAPFGGYSFNQAQGIAAQQRLNQIESQAASAAAPHAVGLGVAVSAEGGTVASAGGQASGAIVYFPDGSALVDQYGAELSFLNQSASVPCECNKGNSFAVGGEVSGGAFLFVTNARSAAELRGCSKTWSLNTPWGSASLSLIGGIWSIGVSGPAMGADISTYQTYSK